MRVYRLRLLALLLLVLLIAGCRGERVAFQFSPAKSASLRLAVALPAAVEARVQVNGSNTPAVAALATGQSPSLHRRRAAAFVDQPRRVAASLVSFAGRKRAARPSEFWTNRSTERGFLLGGVAAGGLGLAVNYLALGSSSRMMLLTTGEFLLWISALLMLTWFVLLLLRARKE